MDWAGMAERAARMSDFDLCGARRDAVATAEAMDEIDRADGGDRAGRYRDEAATYAAELRRRGGAK